MVSRRQFIAGTLGTVAVVAVGGVSALELWPDDERNTPAHHDLKTEKGSFTSRYMKKSVNWRLSHPAQPAVATVFCLHGKDGNADKAFDDLRLPDFVAAADLPLAIASVDGGGDSYYHRRKDGTDAGAMILQELIPLIETKTDTTKRALMGWSMGGYGSLLLTENSPQTFGATVAMSPALWTSSGSTAPGAFDNAEDYKANDVFAKRTALTPSHVHIACGKSDPFYSATQTFLTKLPGAQTDFGPGEHDDNYWRSVAPAGLAFISKTLQ